MPSTMAGAYGTPQSQGPPPSGGGTSATAGAPPPAPAGGDMSLNLNPKAKTISAPSSPAKSRESLLQRVQSLTGQAKEQGVSILGKLKVF